MSQSNSPFSGSDGAFDSKVNGRAPSSGQNAGLQQMDTEFSLRDFLDIILKGKWSILSVFSIVFIAVAVYTFLQDPEYEASSVVMIEQKSGKGQSLEDMLIGAGNRNVYNEVEILKSRKLRRGVAEQLINEKYAPGSDRMLSILGQNPDRVPSVRSVVDRLGGFITVRPISREVDMIRITANSIDPAEAKLIANLVAEEYIFSNRMKSREKVKASKEFLEKQVDLLGDDIGRIENQVELFQAEEGVYSPEDQAGQLVAQIGELKRSRDVVEVEMQVAKAELQALEDRANQAEPGLAKRITSGVERKIESLQEKVFELDGLIDDKYSRNPQLRGNETSDTQLMEYIATRAEYRKRLESLTDQYIAEVKEAGGIDPTEGGSVNPIAYISELRSRIAEKRIEVQGREAELAAIKRRLREATETLDRVPGRSIRQAQLERSLTARTDVYGIVSEKLEEARIAENSEIGYATIVDDAVQPWAPVRPKVALNLIIGAFFGLILGMCLVFLRNAMDNRIRKPEDLRKLGIGVVGIVPDMSRALKDDFEGLDRVEDEGRVYSTSLISLLNPLSPISENYRRMRTNIQFSRPDETIQVIMITSSGPGEGKTVTAANLAVTMAQAGRQTLYMDADLRRPAGHKMFGISKEPGLVEILFDKHPFDPENFKSNIDDLSILPTGSSVPNPAELMGSRKMKDLITKLRNHYDFIVIDTPPVLAVTDAVILSNLSDASIVVASANETDHHSLERTIESFRTVDAPLVGAVLNRFDVRRAYGYYGYRYSYGYGYGYRYGYYDYYGGRGKRRRSSAPSEQLESQTSTS
jgi:capsular exopolysaccharide synthesis family protein